MHDASLPSAARPLCRRAAVLWLAAIALPVLGTGCAIVATSEKPKDKPGFACYDVFGRPAPTIVTKGECDSYTWQWRESP